MLTGWRSQSLHVWARAEVTNQEWPQFVWKQNSSQQKSRMSTSKNTHQASLESRKFLFRQYNFRHFSLLTNWISKFPLILTSIIVESKPHHTKRETTMGEQLKIDVGASQQKTITLLIKTPNQAQEDQIVECVNLNWTVKDLKTRLSTVYPTKPVSYYETDKFICMSRLTESSRLLLLVISCQPFQCYCLTFFVCAYTEPKQEVWGVFWGGVHLGVIY